MRLSLAPVLFAGLVLCACAASRPENAPRPPDPEIVPLTLEQNRLMRESGQDG